MNISRFNSIQTEKVKTIEELTGAFFALRPILSTNQSNNVYVSSVTLDERLVVGERGETRVDSSPCHSIRTVLRDFPSSRMMQLVIF